MGYIKIKRDRLFIDYRLCELTYRGEQLKDNIYKYINYLFDYSLLNERDAVNVKIWDDIMIWAGFLGITKEVTKQFHNLYPNYRNQSAYKGSANTVTYSINLARLTRGISIVRDSSDSE